MLTRTRTFLVVAVATLSAGGCGSGGNSSLAPNADAAAGSDVSTPGTGSSSGSSPGSSSSGSTAGSGSTGGSATSSGNSGSTSGSTAAASGSSSTAVGSGSTGSATSSGSSGSSSGGSGGSGSSSSGASGTADSGAGASAGPCDIYASAATPCVAAHSTVRALYAGYSGNLYQVRRASDKTTKDIGVLTPGGVANSAAQDAFCSGTTCTVSIIYDQSAKGNDLKSAPAGGEKDTPDNEASATALKLTVGGHPVYAVVVNPGIGYRVDATSGIATGDQPEGEYMVTSGTHFNGGCCFDYGNAETNNDDDGAGTMEAVYFGNIKVWGFGSGNGPWIMGDLETGLYSGSAAGFNSNDPTTSYRFTTAMVEGGSSNQWAILGGNAQS